MRSRIFARRVVVAMCAMAIVCGYFAAVVEAVPVSSVRAIARSTPAAVSRKATVGKGLATSAVDGHSHDGAKVVPFVFKGDVRKLHPVPSSPKDEFDLREPSSTKTATGASPQAPNLGLAPMPAPSQNFAGLNYADACTGGPCGAGYPPDVNGDVGSSDYIEAVNSSFAIYAKTGTLRASFTENSLWSGFGTSPCNGNSRGDPVVVYDQQADRWFLTNFAFGFSGPNPVSPFYECIAVSRSSDPVTGGWYLYALRMDPGTPPAGTLNDYPKFGIWIDCLYMAANEFTMPAGTFAGTTYASFSRSDLESGAALTWGLGFISNTTDPFTMIPSNLSGTPPGQLPAPGTPAYFVSESELAYSFEVRAFSVGTNCGGGGTLSLATNVSQTPYTVPGQNIVQQPNTTNTLDSLGDRLMQKVQYRKVGSAESLWVVHSTYSSTVRPQWAQINVTGGTISTTPVQQQIYAPDTTLNRWMGSIASDRLGNVALGYSTSNSTSPNFPSIAYSGRLASDPLNTLPQTEVQLMAGGGSQTNICGGATCHRWGDYTAMSVDPVDNCTFWYINEYYDTQVNGTSGNWHTRIGSFKFPSCVTPTTHTSGDYDGNGTTDMAVFRPSDGVWYVRNVTNVQWGTSGDIPVPGDYDGNGTTDMAIYRPSNGVWYVRNGASAQWGQSGDIPVPGDYDGNGATDMAVFRPSDGTWYIRNVTNVQWGQSGDIPVPGDYDGNGTTDHAVFRPSNGVWYVRNGTSAQWGQSGDVPVPGHYNGNGTTDKAVFRPSDGAWYVQAGTSAQWGASADRPQPGDYDGNGTTDKAVFRPSDGVWYVLGGTNAQWGLASDIQLSLPPSIRLAFFP